MATAITTTPQNITGDFDLQIRGSASVAVTLQKSLGATTTNWADVHTMRSGAEPAFVKNTGTNSYRLAAAVAGVTVEFEQ